MAQDRMSSRMEGFHSYFRQSFKQIWCVHTVRRPAAAALADQSPLDCCPRARRELADKFPEKRVSLSEYLEFAEQLVHHLEGHHGM